jgi:atypical dual specificity phosphatase
MDDYPWYRSLGPPQRRGGHPDYSLIVEHLYVGEYPTHDDADWLHATLGVSAVVNLQDEMDLAAKFLRAAELQASYGNRGIAFHHVPIPDGDAVKLVAALAGLVVLINNEILAGGCVYLHCNAGMNRAPSVAIAYLHAGQGMPFGEACKLVKARRSCLPYIKALEAHYSS